MSNSTPSRSTNIGFWLITSFIIMLAAGLLASLWPFVITAAHAQSDHLLEAGKRAQGSEAQLDFDLATRLNTSNQTAALELARAQIASGQSRQATDTLKRAGEGIEALRLRLRTQLELNQTDNAAASVEKLANSANITTDDLVLIGLANILTDNAGHNPDIIARITVPEAAGRITAAQSDKLALSRELYATGLLEGSKRLLAKLPPSYERDLLLATVEFAQPTPDNLAAAESHAASAVSVNPVSLPARRLLIQILKSAQKTSAATTQQNQLDQLQSDRP